MAHIKSSTIDCIDTPYDLRQLRPSALPSVAEELRQEVISIVSKTGGHLGASLGVIELTVALHYVFNTPTDKLIWDVGHQCYAHKILTARRHKMHTLRQGGGIAGFPKIAESEYDAFGVGHSSTSISAGLGYAIGRDLQNLPFHHVITVIGDGAMSAGLAYEGMNNAGVSKSRMIVILNDNEMSIAPAVGAMNRYLNRLMASRPMLKLRGLAKELLHFMPESIEQLAKRAEKAARDLTTGGNFFEEMGFHYIGPADGHDITELVNILENIRDNEAFSCPILLHIKTQKGKGFTSDKQCAEKYHAVSKFDKNAKEPAKNRPATKSFTQIFASTLTKIAHQDEKIVAITAAMPSGTGLNIFADSHPTRIFDVGIAEQHAVTFAAGLSLQGLKPYVAIYSTFLQRAYDQVIHDVAIQNLPVRFIIDRAGLVGQDGPTHAGSFDIAYLSNVPNIVFLAPSTATELVQALVTINSIDDAPSAIRFARGGEFMWDIEEIASLKPFALGTSRLVHKGKDGIAVISVGPRLSEVEKAHNALHGEVDFTIIDARFIKPLDCKMLEKLAKTHRAIITIEEGSSGGYGAHVNNFLNNSGLRDNNGLVVRNMYLPDTFIDHDSPDKMYEEAGLNASALVKLIRELL